MNKPTVILRNLRITGVHLVDAGDNPLAKVVLFKRQPAVDQGTKTMKTMEEILAGLPAEDRATIEQAMLALKTPAAPAPTPVEDACATGDVKKRDEEIAALRKRVGELESEHALAEMRKRAETMMHIPGVTREQMATILKSAHENLGKSQFDTLAQALEAASKVIERGNVLGEFGTSVSSDGNANLEAIAKSIKDKNPDMPMNVARARARAENPGLFYETSSTRGGR